MQFVLLLAAGTIVTIGALIASLLGNVFGGILLVAIAAGMALAFVGLAIHLDLASIKKMLEKHNSGDDHTEKN